MIQYNTKEFFETYDQPFYSLKEYQSIIIYASIKDDNTYTYDYFPLLEMNVLDSNLGVDYVVEVWFTLYKFETFVIFKNSIEEFTNKFTKQFVLNGVTYDNCLIIELPNSNGDLTKFLIYSSIHGVLQVVTPAQGFVYRSCFECE